MLRMYGLWASAQGQYGSPDQAMACIYVWLRYSAIRQLTWQRNYNTQPRYLGAAQERLTHTVADAHARLDGQVGASATRFTCVEVLAEIREATTG